MAGHDGAVPRDQDPAEVPVAIHLHGCVVRQGEQVVQLRPAPLKPFDSHHRTDLTAAELIDQSASVLAEM